MATDENRRKRFYQELVEDGHIGDEKSYNETMANEASARDLYNKLTTSGWELDDYDTWYEDFGPEKKREQAGTTSPAMDATTKPAVSQNIGTRNRYGQGTTEEQRRDFFNMLKEDGLARDESEYNMLMGNEVSARALYPKLKELGYKLPDFNVWFANFGPQFYGEPKEKSGWFRSENGSKYMVPLAQSGGRYVVKRKDGTRALSWKTRDKRPPLTPRPMPIPGQPNGYREWMAAANESFGQRAQKAATMEIPHGSRPMGSEEAVKRWEDKQRHQYHQKLVKNGYTFATSKEIKTLNEMLSKPETARMVYDDLTGQGWELVNFEDFCDELCSKEGSSAWKSAANRNAFIQELLEDGYSFDFGNGLSFNRRTDFEAFDNMMADPGRAAQQYRRLDDSGQTDRDFDSWLYNYGGWDESGRRRYEMYHDVIDFQPDLGEALSRDEWESLPPYYQPRSLGGSHYRVRHFRGTAPIPTAQEMLQGAERPGGAPPSYTQSRESKSKNRPVAEDKIQRMSKRFEMRPFRALLGDYLYNFFHGDD